MGSYLWLEKLGLAVDSTQDEQLGVADSPTRTQIDPIQELQGQVCSFIQTCSKYCVRISDMSVSHM